jgi:RNA polymerase sigma factor for flagellar operon FliA
MAKPALKKKKVADDKRKKLETKARKKARAIAKGAVKKTSRAARGKPKVSKKELEALKRRDELISQYMPYAASIASRVCKSLSSAVDYEEVLCNARLGLLEAARRFDESHDVDFRTFAYYRIKGAIYDGLRRSGWLPRTLYAKIKFEEAANDYMQHRSVESVREVFQKPDDNTVAETVNTLASIYIISLDASEDIEIADDKGTDIEQRTEFLQIRQYMRDAIGSLPETEKQLIKMYYFQNKTLEEIGNRLGLSKSWTSRLHARALELLFKRIRHRAMVKPDNDNDGGNEE